MKSKKTSQFTTYNNMIELLFALSIIKELPHLTFQYQERHRFKILTWFIIDHSI